MILFFYTVRLNVSLIIGISGHDDGLKINFTRSVCDQTFGPFVGNRTADSSCGEDVVVRNVIPTCCLANTISAQQSLATYVPRDIAELALRVLA